LALHLRHLPMTLIPRRAPVEIEELAVKQIDQLLDPSLSIAERERRIRRLAEGPPEFSHQRIDLPKPRSRSDHTIDLYDAGTHRANAIAVVGRAAEN
jgi:hypothetical protein